LATVSAVTEAAAATTEIFDFRSGMGEAAAARIGPGVEMLLVPCLSDNYAPIIHDPSTGATAVVDTPEVAPIMAALESRGWKLTHILNTHHHMDHTGGNQELVDRTGCQVIGPAGEADRIPALGRPVAQDDVVEVGALRARVLDVGGHTKGHVAYFFPEQKAAFVGDTLFTLGCGRIIEGSALQMWGSLNKLRELPDDTVFYCAHEYTESNARFAEHLGGVPLLPERVAAVRELRKEGRATVPSLLGHEKATNPFLRADSDELRVAAGLPKGAVPVQVFAEVRKRKDKF